MPINGSMDEEWGVHAHRILRSLKEIQVLKFAGNWVWREISMLSGISQVQKEKYHIFSLMWNLDLNTSTIPPWVHSCASMHPFVSVWVYVSVSLRCMCVWGGVSVCVYVYVCVRLNKESNLWIRTKRKTFILTYRIINQGDITSLNVYILNSGIPNFIKRILKYISGNKDRDQRQLNDNRWFQYIPFFNILVIWKKEAKIRVKLHRISNRPNKYP